MSTFSGQPIHSPQEIPSRFAKAWNERDANKIAALFDEDADFINVVGIWWNNREDIQKAHDYGLRVIFNQSDLSVTKTEVKYLSETIAVVHARMRLKGQSSHQDTADQPGLRFNIITFVVHKTENGWICAAAHNTDIVPGKETNIVKDGTIKAIDYRK